jgi:hypothetical protein
LSDEVLIKKNYKDADGKVITAPRNFTTQPMQTGKSIGKRSFF